ncbi:beta-galactosidase [Trinickia terrae]|uniref:Beta-galactosidase n=1 Tax=Trinickia terrae TaxID=2571161 RepID=A0A4U1I666_9BURK|nr:alpha-amylase family protein [Trinickia terrae]TKC88851.1 beta-galactosidase [Trinickia terrae]
MPKGLIKPLRYRQVHLDFHTSEHIPQVGAQFDPVDFAATFKAAHVDSVTVFAKCHHGWSYYPTAVGKPHPHLVRPDLLGEMIDALSASGIANQIYLSVQWDELAAREHPGWRVMDASNDFQRARPSDPSTGRQLSPAWHALCLNHARYRRYVLDQAREVASRYRTQGIFLDIVTAQDCVCPACIERMLNADLNPENPADRRKNGEAVAEQFRRETSEVLFSKFPGLRIFYNGGHIEKKGEQHYWSCTHLELESLPTGGWGYDHFPGSARYAAALGFDFVGHTGKFHTSWGEFGGYKQPQALEYETALMAALGSKCLIGDQLHPSGRINHATYRTIAPAYSRIEALEPYLERARQVSEVAILSAEHLSGHTGRNHPSDDGAAQMLLELKWQFDIVDADTEFDRYRIVILPDEARLDATLAARLSSYVERGGKLIASWRSVFDANGAPTIDAGIVREDGGETSNPSYVLARGDLDTGLPPEPFVLYDEAETVRADGAQTLATIRRSYFNRSYRHFCSHQHTPDDPAAPTAGAAVTEYNGVAYVAYPIFRLYRAIGQPLYKYLVRGLLNRLARPAVETDLPSAGRAMLTHQPDTRRYVLHLLYATPQVRGKAVPDENGGMRPMEMIEDVPVIGPVSVTLRLACRIARVYDALTAKAYPFEVLESDTIRFTLPRLHIHAAIVAEQA